MGDGPKQELEVSAKLAGLGKMKAEWLDFAGDMLAPVAILAAGGSKASAVWMGVGNVFMTKVLGPLGMVAGAAAGFLIVTKKLVGAWKDMGMGAAKQLELLTIQFKPLLGSMALAKKKAAEMFDFGRKSPFEVPDVATGGQMLEALTRGALSGNKGMTLVGDAAAVAGTNFSEMAQEVGRLYDGLQSGRPVGMVAQRMQELGVISGATRNQIESMQAANASGSEVWAVAERDILRFKGAMDDAQGTLAQLESTYRDTQREVQGGFSGGFMEGEKAGMQASITLMEALKPVARNLGEIFGAVSNRWEKFKAGIVSAVATMPGFTQVLTSAGYAVTAFAGALVLAAGAKMGKFMVGLLAVSKSTKELEVAMGGAVTMERVAAASSGALAAAKGTLGTVMAALKAGHYAEAAACLRASAVTLVATIRTNSLATAQVVLRGALNLTWRAVKFVRASLVEMSVAVLKTPLGAAAAILVAVGGAMLFFANRARQAREDLDALSEASRSMVASLQQQVLAIRTVADQRKTEADIVSRLAEAYSELGDAQAKGNKASEGVIRKKIENLKKVQKDARGVKPEKSQEVVDREDFLREAQKDAEKTRNAGVAGKGEESALNAATWDKADNDEKRRRANAAIQAEKELERRQEESRRSIDDHSEQKGALESQREKARTILDETGSTHGRKAQAQKDLEEAQAGLDKIAASKARQEGHVSDIALNSGSELAALKEKVKLSEDLNDAESKLIEAEKNLGNVKHGPDDSVAETQKASEAARREVQAASDRVTAAKEAAGRAGVADWSPEDRRAAVHDRDRIVKERNDNIDPRKAAEDEQRVADAERALVQEKLDGEEQILGFRNKGYERERMMLEIENQKLDEAHEMNGMDEERYQRKKAILAAQAVAAAKQADEQRNELQGALEISKLRRMEGAARNRGALPEAEALRKAAEAREAGLARKAAEKEAEGSNMGGHEREQYIQRRVEEDRQAREQARQQEEKDKALTRAGSRANQGGAVAGLKAQLLRMQGRGGEADKLQEQAARRKDEVERKEAQEKYLKEGFSADDAKKMSDVDVKTAQAQRLMDRLGGSSGTIVASSLAAIGGGGGTFGGDQTVNLLDRIAKAVEEANDPKKIDVNEGTWG